MKLDNYLRRLQASREFKSYLSSSPKAYFCAGFFVLNLKDKKAKNEVHLDFYNPSTKKIMTFKFEGTKILPVEMDSVNKQLGIKGKQLTPKKVKGTPQMDISKIKGIIQDEMHNRGITNKIEKILVVLHDIDGELIWNCTCFLSGLALLRTHIEDKSESVLLMEKSSFFDFIKPIQLKPGQSPKDAIREFKKKMREQSKRIDVEKAEGEHEGFIG